MLRKYLDIIKIKEGETIVIAIKEDVTQKELESLAEDIKEHFGEKVVIIGGVDKVIVTN